MNWTLDENRLTFTLKGLSAHHSPRYGSFEGTLAIGSDIFFPTTKGQGLPASFIYWLIHTVTLVWLKTSI
jgi:hypothetical protein